MKSATRTRVVMRALIITLLIAFALPTGPAVAGGNAGYAIGVDGLACPFCAYGIEKQLSRIAGVETVATDIDSATVNVIMEEGATLEEAAAAKAVDDAGFTLRSFERKAASE